MTMIIIIVEMASIRKEMTERKIHVRELFINNIYFFASVFHLKCSKK